MYMTDKARGCGCSYQVKGYTTRDEAHRMATLLGLQLGIRLLDVGAGAGWPGLFFAKEAKYLHHETSITFGNTLKVYVHFEIIDPDPYNGTRLYRAYRVSDIFGKPRKNGRFKLKKRSDLFLTLCRLFDGKLRPDQISLRGLKSFILKISVRTVTTDYQQRPLPQMLHCSVVDDIKEICAGAKPRLTVI